MLPPVFGPEIDRDAATPPRAPWTTPALRMLAAAEAEFGEGLTSEGSIAYS